MIETANKIYNRKYTELAEIKMNGRECYSFSGAGQRMVVLKSTFLADEERYNYIASKRDKRLIEE